MVKLRFTHFPPYIRGRNIEFMSNLREIRSNLDIIVELLEETRRISVSGWCESRRQLLKEIQRTLERQYFIELERIEWQRIELSAELHSLSKHWGLDPR